MKRVHKGKVEHVVSLLLLITFGILLGVTTVTAQEIEDIAPDQSFEYLPLLQGQRATLGVTQSTPYGVYSVLVTSIGNKTLGASISNLPPDTTGWWTISAVGTGAKNGYSAIKLGLVPWSGLTATINIGTGGSFALVFSTVFITNKTAAELADDPVSYNVAIACQ